MPSIIQEVWIFTKDGIPIVEYCKEDCINESLLGGFLSAIKTFSKEISGEGIESFTMNEYKFIIHTCCNNHALVVCRAPIDIKDKKVENFCKIIGKMFEESYTPEELKKWSGDCSHFDNFKNKLENYFKLANL
ncbi:MAG: hypothetical protein ACTSQS_10890 [Promethearchaeota archaeon]